MYNKGKSLDKLVWSNCHKELHDNIWDISELNLRREEEVEPNGTDKETV